MGWERLRHRDKRMVELHREGWSMRRLARRYGLTTERVRQILRREGITPSMSRYYVARRAAEREVEIERARSV